MFHFNIIIKKELKKRSLYCNHYVVGRASQCGSQGGELGITFRTKQQRQLLFLDQWHTAIKK